jgi:hypothetical protein
VTGWVLVRLLPASSREQPCRAVAGWIDEYNTVRRHSTNGLRSPGYCADRRAELGHLAPTLGLTGPETRQSIGLLEP